MNVHLLGRIDLKQSLALQDRLVYEAGEPESPPITLLLGEHPLSISLGRSGSRGDIHFSQRELEARAIPVDWVSRGGGAMLHGPGQLAIYPVVSLERCDWTVGQFFRRLLAGVQVTCRELGWTVQVDPVGTVWGRIGPIAATGIAVRYGGCLHGMWLNLNPDMYLMQRVGAVTPRAEYGEIGAKNERGKPEKLSSVLSETGRPAKMNLVKTVLVEQLAVAFETGKFHLQHGHPLLKTDIQSS